MRALAIGFFLAVLMVAMPLLAQTAIPAGTILPIQLNSSINAKKLKTGTVVTARVMQSIPLSRNRKIPAGAKVIGRVTALDRSNGSVTLRFDTLLCGKRRIPITTNLRAIASMMEVEQAQIPETGPDRGTSEYEWITQRIGGESTNLMLLRVAEKPGARCRGEVADNNRPQAFWVFSSDACGAYGFRNLTIAHAGRTEPVGTITLASSRGDINIRGGSGLLLRVD